MMEPSRSDIYLKANQDNRGPIRGRRGRSSKGWRRLCHTLNGVRRIQVRKISCLLTVSSGSMSSLDLQKNSSRPVRVRKGLSNQHISICLGFRVASTLLKKSELIIFQYRLSWEYVRHRPASSLLQWIANHFTAVWCGEGH